MNVLKQWMADNRRTAVWLSDQTTIPRETIQRVKDGRVPTLRVAVELERITGIPAKDFVRERG